MEFLKRLDVRRALALAPVLITGACVPHFDDDLSRVTAPRIVGIETRADALLAGEGAAELAPETAGTFTALVVAPDGVAVPQVRWQLCLARKPLTELGAVNPDCLESLHDGSVAPELEPGDTTAFEVPRNACALFGPDPPPTGRPVDADPTGGYYLPVVAVLGDQEPAVGTVRLDCGLYNPTHDASIAYGARHVPNENPAIDSVSLVQGSSTRALQPIAGGNDVGCVGQCADAVADAGAVAPPTPASVRPGQHVTLRAAWATCPRPPDCSACAAEHDAASCPSACASTTTAKSLPCTGAETYPVYDRASGRLVDQREGITVSWYASAGSFDDRATGLTATDPDGANTTNGWTAPGSSSTVDLWAVIRDDRGGTSMRRYRIGVGP